MGTRMWDEEEITDEDLWELFPEQSFPDIDALSLKISSNSIEICGNDTEWILPSSDFALAAGPGCMIFHCASEPEITLETAQGVKNLTFQEAKNYALPIPEDVRVIKKGSPWEFSFTVDGSPKMRIYAPITGISWQPEDDE